MELLHLLHSTQYSLAASITSRSPTLHQLLHSGLGPCRFSALCLRPFCVDIAWPLRHFYHATLLFAWQTDWLINEANHRDEKYIVWSSSYSEKVNIIQSRTKDIKGTRMTLTVCLSACLTVGLCKQGSQSWWYTCWAPQLLFHDTTTVAVVGQDSKNQLLMGNKLFVKQNKCPESHSQCQTLSCPFVSSTLTSSIHLINRTTTTRRTKRPTTIENRRIKNGTPLEWGGEAVWVCKCSTAFNSLCGEWQRNMLGMFLLLQWVGDVAGQFLWLNNFCCGHPPLRGLTGLWSLLAWSSPCSSTNSEPQHHTNIEEFLNCT